MLILAFDTSAAHCAVALLSDDTAIQSCHEPMTKGQAENLVPLCEAVLSKGGYEWSDLDAIGVGIGPGNFTGIRIAVSAARGLSLALDIPSIGVNILEAQALGISSDTVLSTVDARQNKIYSQGVDSSQSPTLLELDDLPDFPEGLLVVGHAAQQIAEKFEGTAMPPRYPVAEAIARIAKTRVGQENPRPAPLYIREADAAPPRDRAPEILDA